MDVSIIIVNYHTAHLIEPLLGTIAAQTQKVNYEVIVVDNDPTAQERSILAPYMSNILYLPLSENVGFGRANNAGLEKAQGRNIFFLNPDTLLLNSAIDLMSHYLDEHTEVGVVGGNLYGEDRLPTHSYQMCLPGLIWELNLFFGKSSLYKLLYGKSFSFNYTSHPKKVAYVTGADMMVKREVLDKVGGFDPAFFMYFEETELSYRIQKAGYSTMSLPQAKICHLESKTSANELNKQTRILHSRRIYYQLTGQSIFFPNIIRRLNYFLRYLLSYLSGRKEKVTFWSSLRSLI